MEDASDYNYEYDSDFDFEDRKVSKPTKTENEKYMILKQMYWIVEDVLWETQEGVIGIHSNFNTAPRSISYMDDFKV